MTTDHTAVDIGRHGDAQTGNYSSGSACRNCLVKHLMKASIELSEYLEDKTRIEEFALCIGDIACAEDHAKALSMNSLANFLRDTRNELALTNQGHVATIRKYATGILREDMLEQATRKDKAREKAEADLREINSKAVPIVTTHVAGPIPDGVKS